MIQKRGVAGDINMASPNTNHTEQTQSNLLKLLDKANAKLVSGEVNTATKGVTIDQQVFIQYYWPLIEHYQKERTSQNIENYIVGIQGCQGSGKTILATFLKLVLEGMGYCVESFSIDDFYKSHSNRIKLQTTHPGNPFYHVRGVPGTHRHNYLHKQLSRAKGGLPFDIPIFNKHARSESGDVEGIRQVQKPPKFTIFEGWCVGISYVGHDEFISIMGENPFANQAFNELDPNHEHYKTVLQYVQKYEKTWQFIDNWTSLYIPDIEQLEEWRYEQAKRSIATLGQGMTREQVHDFVKPYIPFTKLVYHKAISDADFILRIGSDHLPIEMMKGQNK